LENEHQNAKAQVKRGNPEEKCRQRPHPMPLSGENSCKSLESRHNWRVNLFDPHEINPSTETHLAQIETNNDEISNSTNAQSSFLFKIFNKNSKNYFLGIKLKLWSKIYKMKLGLLYNGG
tara:strand:+ start:311 stop:670 length:360 start_codon:yes stop_codon:yes gene_type:complete